MGGYDATWTSLSSHPFPQWLWDAKFGIYTHWGLTRCRGMPGTVNTLTEAGMRVFIDRTYGSDMVLTGAGPIRNAQYVYPEDIAGFSMLGNDGDLRWE